MPHARPPLSPVRRLPGLAYDHAYWQAQFEALSTVTACQVPGYGELDTLAAVARHVLDVAPAERFAPVDHSMDGGEDAWSPLTRREAMRALLPQSQPAVIEDSGHMISMEQPQAVSQAMLVWLRAS